MKRFLILLLAVCCTVQLHAQTSIKITQVSDKGSPIIFLPHIGCSSEMWQKIAASYKKNYSCYLLDFAGFDRLSPISTPFYTKVYVIDLCQYIEDNNLKNIILVGQNYGAFIAVKVIEAKALNVKAIVVSDFYPKLSMVLDSSMTKEKLEIIQASVKKAIIESDTTSFASNQRQTARMMNFTDTSDAELFVKWQLNSDRKTLAGTLCEQLGEDLRPVLESNEVPVLAFSTWYFAKAYKQIPVSEAHKQLTKMYGNARYVKHVFTETAKDFMASDQPEWFIEEMNSFLKQHHFGR